MSVTNKEHSHNPTSDRSQRLAKWVEALPPDVARRKPTAYAPELAAVQANALRARSQWEDLKEQSSLAFDSGLLPRSIDTRERAVTVALMGKELGIAPMQSLCGIYVVNGMVALRGSLMLRLIYERVPGARITVLTPPDRAEQECNVEMTRPNGTPQVFRFTLEDAKKAGFLNKPVWQQHTATMLRWAAIRTGARVVFADAIAGCYMEDEIPAADTATMPVETPQLASQEAIVESRRTGREDSETEAAPHCVPETPSPAPYAPRTVVAALPRKVTEKQVKRLYAIGYQNQWNRQEIGDAVEFWFQKRDAADLNRVEYDDLCQYLLDHGSKDLQSGHAPASAVTRH